MLSPQSYQNGWPAPFASDFAIWSGRSAATIEAKGGTVKLLRKGHRRLPAEAREERHRPPRPIRSRIEKIFGTWKRSYRFRAMRWMGLVKAKLQVHLAVIAYNIKCFFRLQTA